MSSAADAPARTAPSTKTVIGAAVLDLVFVVAFVLIGRSNHGEDPIVGALTTLWPFAVGLVVGWVVCLAWRAPTAVLRTGIPVWVATVAIGMLLRAASGQGIAVSFIVVATIVLAVFLLGWRGIARLVSRLRRPRA